MKYVIPVYRYKKLSKLVNRAQNKGANVSLTTGNLLDKEFEIVVNDSSSRTSHSVKVMVECVEVELTGEYKENGFEFVATIEHTPNGNIIRCINSELESSIPSKYKTCGPECEHCHTTRSRKDTYLIYNESTKEFKQVGKTCLLDYTKGLTPETCELFSGLTSSFLSAEELDYDDLMMMGGDNSINWGFSNKDIKKIAYDVVKESGYIKDVTAKTMSEYIERNYKPVCSDKDIEAIDEYARSIDSEYGYMRNASLAWLNDKASYRDFALLASFVSVYFKHLAEVKRQEKASKTTNYVGTVGDKITIKVETMRVIYTKYYQFNYYCGTSEDVWEIIDTKGNTYIWATSTDINGDEVDTITGTIKDHKEYRGTKQTVLTRCKVTYFN